MQEIRGPGFPDTVPDELVAVYGAQARHAVKYRRSWRYRVGRRIGRLGRGHDPWFIAAAALLWLIIAGGSIGTIALVATRWPRPTLDTAVLVAIAAMSAAVTVFVCRRRFYGDGV